MEDHKLHIYFQSKRFTLVNTLRVSCALLGIRKVQLNFDARKIGAGFQNGH